MGGRGKGKKTPSPRSPELQTLEDQKLKLRNMWWRVKANLHFLTRTPGLAKSEFQNVNLFTKLVATFVQSKLSTFHLV